MTKYLLIDPVTGRNLGHAVPFLSATAAHLFALIHDIRDYQVKPIVLDNPDQFVLPLEI
jgi:hypothetical protein